MMPRFSPVLCLAFACLGAGSSVGVAQTQERLLDHYQG